MREFGRGHEQQLDCRTFCEFTANISHMQRIIKIQVDKRNIRVVLSFPTRSAFTCLNAPNKNIDAILFSQHLTIKPIHTRNALPIHFIEPRLARTPLREAGVDA